MSCSDIFLGLIAVLFPPIAVWIKCGICSAHSLLNILLCMLGYIPGLLHAWYIIAKYPEHDYDAVDGDVEHQGRVTYYYISHEPGTRRTRREQGTRVYGTIPAGSKPGPPPPSQNQSHSHSHTQNVQYQQSSFQQSQQSGVVRTEGGPSAAAPGSSTVGNSSNSQNAPPPSYSEAVRGDHKVQT